METKSFTIHDREAQHDPWRDYTGTTHCLSIILALKLQLLALDVGICPLPYPAALSV
jgi:hypothetical protein